MAPRNPHRQMVPSRSRRRRHRSRRRQGRRGASRLQTGNRPMCEQGSGPSNGPKGEASSHSSSLSLTYPRSSPTRSVFIELPSLTFFSPPTERTAPVRSTCSSQPTLRALGKRAVSASLKRACLKEQNLLGRPSGSHPPRNLWKTERNPLTSRPISYIMLTKK